MKGTAKVAGECLASPTTKLAELQSLPMESDCSMMKTRVLLADDHALVRAGIRNALQELPGIEVVGEVGDGVALHEALANLQPDLVLIDVSMPEFEPVSAVRRIRALYGDLRILVVSAHDDDAYVRGLLSVGVDGYHLKDQPLSDLRFAVQRVLAGERWISSPLLDKLLSLERSPDMSCALTIRQRELLQALQQGLDNQTIATRLCLSVKTVENHLTRLYRQLGVQSRLEAVNMINHRPEILGMSGQMAAIPPTPGPVAGRQRFQVLLVDDNSRYREQLRRMVGKAYPQALIYEAANVTEALHIAQRIAPHLALIDIVLGEEDGIACARRIRALAPASRVVLISAYPDREFHRMGLEAGAVALLDKKDLDSAALRQIIEDVTH